MTVLAAEHLSKSFSGVIAVEDVSIELRSGEIVGLVGKNGAGKSTLIRMLTGALQPDSGRVTLDGKELALTSPHAAHEAGIAVMHQELEDVPGLSVTENVALGTRLPRRGGIFVSWSELHAEAVRVLADLDPTIDPRGPTESLSVAQLRLVMVARALYRRASFIVLDEPSTSLTAQELEQLHAVCRRIRDAGGTVVYVSHRLNEILSLTDRVIVMRDGRHEITVATNELTHAALVHAITGEEAPETVARSKRPSAPRGEPVLSVRDLVVAGSGTSVSFDAHAGEVLGIAGLVGSGRTELLRAVFGADSRDGGSVAVHGRSLRSGSVKDAMKAGLALLPEDRHHQGVILDFDLRRNVTLASLDQFRRGRRLAVPVPTRERDAAWSLIRRLGMKASSDEQSVATLSGGTQQKVVLAKWLQRNAEVFLFDEPTAGIDVYAKSEIYTLIEELAAAGKSIVLVSSDFSELVAASHRVLVMRDGSLVGELAGQEIAERKLLGLCYEVAEEAA